jgi:glutamate dehydrogenase (NAD(P)+)
VAVSDLAGGIYHEGALDIEALQRHRQDGGTLSDFPAGECITNDELLALPCAALIPAAAGDVITRENWQEVQAEIIIEAANHPLTADADTALSERGVLIVPDILANAGGVTVSYFEWTQNIQQFRWEEERVSRELARILTHAYRAVHALASERGLTLRRAAYLIAVDRVAKAIRLRGFV